MNKIFSDGEREGAYQAILTRNFVTNQFAAFHLADAREERFNLLLSHRLWQIVDDQIGLCIVGNRPRAAVLLNGIQSIGNHCLKSNFD